MIETDKRKAIFLLHQEGMSVREIARRLGISRNTIKVIIQQGGAMPARRVRSDKQQIDPELLRQLYQQCEGWVQRVHEKLVEEHHLQVKYSTLTRRLRQLGISTAPLPRCQRVPDEPGAEMQHDTTLYQLTLGDQRVRMVATMLLPALLQTALSEVQPHLQPLSNEMLPPRGAALLGICPATMHH